MWRPAGGLMARGAAGAALNAEGNRATRTLLGEPTSSLQYVTDAVVGGVVGIAPVPGANAVVFSKAAPVQKAAGKLTSIGERLWESTAGLIYGADRAFGNRVQHVLAHTVPDPSKTVHSVFNVSRDKVLALVDEAWSMRGASVGRNGRVFVVPMGRVVGTAGETAVRVVVKPGTTEILTAYPVMQ